MKGKEEEGEEEEEEEEALPDLPERLLLSLFGTTIDAGAPAGSVFPRPVAKRAPGQRGK